jgi:hypothetical protein
MRDVRTGENIGGQPPTIQTAHLTHLYVLHATLATTHGAQVRSILFLACLQLKLSLYCVYPSLESQAPHVCTENRSCY